MRPSGWDNLASLSWILTIFFVALVFWIRVLNTLSCMTSTENDGVMLNIMFDDPRSSTDFRKARSGRLNAKTFTPNNHVTEKVFEKSSPGSLGMSLYSYRVADLSSYRSRVTASAATRVSRIVFDEFGVLSFSFIAPDGYWWQIIERK